ncbi:hypothetical protein STVA_17330 [Allostella vacuolata]|nr:hypothetical protein STVA_17330 [Stella vacuolata]
MAKLFSPLNAGAFELAHRVVALGSSMAPPAPGAEPHPAAYADRMRAGGLVVAGPMAFGQAPAEIAAWRRVVGAVHDCGGVVLAQLPGAGAAAQHARAAVHAQQAGFDGLEVDVTLSGAGMAFIEEAGRDGGALLDVLAILAETWGRDRIGVRLAPCSRGMAIDPARRLRLFTDILTMLGEEEVAYVHLVVDEAYRLGGPEGPIGSSGLARDLRSAFRGILIASGDYSEAEAIRLVDSRWADAVEVRRP